MDTKEVPAQRFLVIEEDVTCDNLGDSAERTVPGLREAFDAAGFSCEGGMQIICQDSKEAHEPWRMMIAMPVSEEKPVPEPYAITEVPGFTCLALDYVGPIAGIKAGWGRMWQEIREKNIPVTSQWREVYKHWEGEDSPNNIVELQVGTP